MKATLNNILIIIIGILLGITGYFYVYTSDLDTKLERNENLIEVLGDSVRYHHDEYGRVVAEKKALVTTVKELESHNAILTDNQKRLLSEVKNHKKVKAGVQLKEKVVLRNVPVVVNDTVMVIDSLDLENEKTIVLKHVKGGTEVSITNSNPVFKTVDVDGLLIPEKKKWYNTRFMKAMIFVGGVFVGYQLTR